MITVKRIYLICVCIGISTMHVAAQKFEMSFNTGLAMPIAGSSIPGIYEVDTQGNKTALIVTGGGGFNVGLTGGYNFSPHIGLLLNINKLIGLPGKFDQYPAKNTLKPSSTSISPIIRISTGNEKKINWYMKIGLSLVLAKADLETKVQSLNGVSTNEFRGNSALGFLGAVGMDLKLKDRMKFYVELETRMATWAPATLTNTENFGGPLNPTVEFQKYVPTGSPATKQLPLSIPFNSLALNVGVKF